MARRIVRAIAAMVMVASATVVAFGAPSGAALRDAKAWWWQAQSGIGPPLPPPAHVPEGGTLVSRGIDGATAFMAVRFTLDADEVQPTLTLRVANDVGGEGATMAACAAGSAWAPTLAGPWADRPAVACDAGSAVGLRSSDGSTWRFDLTPLVVGRAIDVVIIPGTEGDPYDISFEGVVSDDLTTTRRAATTTTTSTPATTAPTTQPPVATFEPPPTFTLPPAPLLTAPPTTAFQPAVPDEDQGLRTSAPLITDGETALSPLPLDDGPSPRRLGLLVLVGAATTVFMMRDEELPEPHALGPLAARHPEVMPSPTDDPNDHGIGRFRRPRNGPPPSLG